MKYYLVEENEQLLVIGAKGFIPTNAIGEVPSNISKQDYVYLNHRLTVDEQTQDSIVEIYIDEDAKSLGEAQKLVAEEELAWANLRTQRDKLLTACDYTQLVDSPLSQELKEAYQVYRQALRDLPSNTIDPHNPVYPELPGEE